MQRIAVVGCSGSGKTTLARRLSRATGAPHIELDSIYHQRDWQPLPRVEMRARVAAMLEQPAWIADGNYRDTVGDLVWRAADTVVWLDLPRVTTTLRVVRRTLGRLARGTELWNGNRERLRNVLRLDPDENIILWAWTQHPSYRRTYESVLRGRTFAHLDVVRLRSRRAVERFLRSAGA